MSDVDLQPFDGDYCKHTHTRKVLGSELHRCQNCPVLLRVGIAEDSELEALKRARFRPEGKAERAAKSLAALNQPGSIELSLDEWRLITDS